MWLPGKAYDLFRISHDTTTALREELALVKAERDQLKDTLNKLQIMSDWLRMQVNTLQVERTALTEKLYGIKIPAPEIVRAPVMGDNNVLEDFSFEDIGNQMAKKLGLPVYEHN